jgi:TonB family protein
MHVGLLRRGLVAAGRVCLLVAGLGWVDGAVAAGQTPGADLIGRSLYLRGLWEQDQLNFDATGQPVGKATAGSVTLSGVDVVEAKMHGKSLVLTGYRVALVAKSNPKEGLERRTIRSNAQVGKDSGKLIDKMKITIEPDAAGSFAEGLNAVFVEGLSGLGGSIPDSWHCYARSYFVPTVAENADKTVEECATGRAHHETVPVNGARPVKRVGGDVLPPKVTYQVEPKFTLAARKMKLTGATLVNLTVDKDGVPSKVKIVRAAGAGLDEAAVEAVARYKFAPATQNGVAVAVTLNIEVNYQIF